jgi:hypothetical protein
MNDSLPHPGMDAAPVVTPISPFMSSTSRSLIES